MSLWGVSLLATSDEQFQKVRRVESQHGSGARGRVVDGGWGGCRRGRRRGLWERGRRGGGTRFAHAREWTQAI